MKFNCAELMLVKVFRSYSKVVSRYPLLLICIFLLLAIGLGMGVYFLRFESNTEYLFSPKNSQAREDRDTIEELFPVDDLNTLPNRLIYFTHRMVSIIVTCEDGGNVLRSKYIDAILDLDDTVKAAQVLLSQNTSAVNFTTVCSKWKGECFINPALEYYQHFNNLSIDVSPITYPSVTLENVQYNVEAIFGGAQVENGKLISADAFFMNYILQNSPENANSLSKEWETLIIDYIGDFDSDLIEVNAYYSEGLDAAQRNLAVKVLPYVGISYFILVCFAIVSCIMVRDNRQSKPWLGVMGVVSASLGLVSAVGFLCYCGVPFNQVTVSMPFIILGIGLDDMFIMIAAWRKTDPNLPVKERMEDTYGDAAVSITITSFTDIMAFCIGSISPIPGIQIFCLYTGVAVLYNYIYQITFFGAFMVLFGHMEAYNCNGVTCIPNKHKACVRPSVETISAAPSIQHDDNGPVKRHSVMVFFRDYFSKLISHPICMAAIVFLYFIYLGTAGYFCSTIELGLEQKNVAEEGTMTHEFLDLLARYFKETGDSVSIVIAEPYEYWELEKQNELEAMVESLHMNDHIKPRNYTEFWLDDYKQYLLTVYNTTNVSQDTFVNVLRNQFLQLPCCGRFSLDVKFDGNIITSSRLVLVSRDVSTTTKQEELLLSVRESASSATDNLGVSILAFSPQFVLLEQYIIIIPMTIQTLSIAVASMLVVSLLIIPNIAVSVMVTISVASILVGVLGYMSFWKVALESISMFMLVLCIGFSVDFSAHIAYAFVMTVENELLPTQKVSRALYLLGYPILQSGWSTIIGVALLFFSASYIFRTFAKIMTLVMCLGMLHGLVFLPVAMKMFDHLYHVYCRSKKTDKESEKDEKDVKITSLSDNITAADNSAFVVD
ncbi:Patched domain-containing protein 3 [Holothuria leucospilota]|uniref:Patched domain-containing protein 3 n=1 Tax=Holothuria leucospilota TaxID=206669 RepID=A0A9Q1C1L8_HOLLE|nr:Patched domain-containing protein 3 [Holothuria leucospilota]